MQTFLLAQHDRSMIKSLKDELRTKNLLERIKFRGYIEQVMAGMKPEYKNRISKSFRS